MRPGVSELLYLIAAVCFILSLMKTGVDTRLSVLTDAGCTAASAMPTTRVSRSRSRSRTYVTMISQDRRCNRSGSGITFL